jgi:MoaA/NifB/PqqE/SkfB family radical SAM enzyme
MLLMPPFSVYLEVSDSCFFRCKHCNIWKHKYSAQKMDLDKIRIILFKLHKWLGSFNLAFSGGEPLLNPSFLSIIKIANELGIKTHCTTNAYLIDNVYADKLIKSGINSISVSIDGLGKIHNATRGINNSFQKAEHAIKLLLKTKKTNKSSLRICTNSIVMKTNIKSLKKLVEWGQNVGLDGMNFQPLWESFGNKTHNPYWFKNNNLWPDYRDVVLAINDLVSMKKNGYPINNSLKDLKSFMSYYKNPQGYGKNNFCYVGYRNFSILLNGDVQLCVAKNSIGNILKDDPKIIWVGQKAQNVRKDISTCNLGCKILLCNTKPNQLEASRQIFNVIKQSVKNYSNKFN